MRQFPASELRQGDCRRARADASRDQIANYGKLAVTGWRRENGRVGVRNHVVILPLDDLSNAASEAVANNVKGTLALPHAYGRLQFGADLDLFFRTLIGIGANPNVAAVDRHRYRGKLDQTRRRRHRQDWQASDRFRHRRAWRYRHHRARLLRGERISALGLRTASARHARCRSSGSRPNAASWTRPRACRHVRRSATCTTS